MTETITQEQLQEKMAVIGPYILVSQMPEVTCCKCGNKVPAPGRMTFFDGQTCKTWCDCITEKEMQDVVAKFEQVKAMYCLDEKQVDA